MVREIDRIQSVETVGLFVCVILFAAAAPTKAYVDPGSGSMLVQLLLGGVAGIAVAVRIYWRRLTARFRSSHREPASNEGQSDRSSQR